MNEKEPKVLQDSADCEHLWLDYEPGPCPVCAEIKAAREGNLKENLECLEMARKEGREEMLELACGFMDKILEEHFRQAYKERFNEQG